MLRGSISRDLPRPADPRSGPQEGKPAKSLVTQACCSPCRHRPAAVANTCCDKDSRRSDTLEPSHAVLLSLCTRSMIHKRLLKQYFLSPSHLTSCMTCMPDWSCNSVDILVQAFGFKCVSARERTVHFGHFGALVLSDEPHGQPTKHAACRPPPMCREAMVHAALGCAGIATFRSAALQCFSQFLVCCQGSVSSSCAGRAPAYTLGALSWGWFCLGAPFGVAATAFLLLQRAPQLKTSLQQS